MAGFAHSELFLFHPTVCPLTRCWHAGPNWENFCFHFYINSNHFYARCLIEHNVSCISPSRRYPSHWGRRKLALSRRKFLFSPEYEKKKKKKSSTDIEMIAHAPPHTFCPQLFTWGGEGRTNVLRTFSVPIGQDFRVCTECLHLRLRGSLPLIDKKSDKLIRNKECLSCRSALA